MNILHTVQLYSPSVGGSQEVIRQISERLTQRGHAVTVATSSHPDRTDASLNGVKIEQFDITGNTVDGIRGQTRLYQEFLLDSRFDVMLNYAAQQWATDLVFPIIKSLRCRKVIAPCGFSRLFIPAYRGYFARLADDLRCYDHLVFHAEHYRDIDYARTQGLSHFSVIPNGASEQEFDKPEEVFRSRHGIPTGVPLLLTVGSHTGIKGHRLVMQAFRQAQIGPSVLLVIGNESSKGGCARRCRWRAAWMNLAGLGQKRIVLLDPPRHDVVAAFQAADLFVFGSNIEYSPLVLFEAMASHTPFVTVACGNAAEIAAAGGGGIVVPTVEIGQGMVDADPQVFAREIEDLMHDPRHRKQLGENGYAAWKNRFTWENIASQYEQLYLRLLGG
ncbi:MAG TPA: glycosyltransferase family 4 protein [Aggregatilineales bacterium]|nr:glycosyltransferase family 4 protein [Aggregatilineales bacterium]